MEIKDMPLRDGVALPVLDTERIGIRSPSGVVTWINTTALKEYIPTTGLNGWSPVLSVVTDVERRVFQVADWVGGTGSKPSVGGYIGSTGLVSDIAQAVNIRGPQGASGAGTVDSVNGQTGIVVLTKSDLGLGSVDNTSDANKPISSATQTALNGKANTVHTHVPSQITQDANNRFTTDTEKATWNAKQDALGFTAEDTANKGVANGYTPLGADIKVPSAYLPSYVDDVLEFANLASFPTTGESGKIYVALDTNITYRWGGSTYVEISSGAVQSVNGNTGVVVITKSTIGLGNVDNTTDALKPISNATQTALNLKADINSPVLTGTPQAPTASLGTSTTQVATTQFVQQNKPQVYESPTEPTGGTYFDGDLWIEPEV